MTKCGILKSFGGRSTKLKKTARNLKTFKIPHWKFMISAFRGSKRPRKTE